MKDLQLKVDKVQALRIEGKYQEAIEIGEVLIEEAIAEEAYSVLLPTYIVVAASYYCIGEIEKALNYLIKHEELCEEYGRPLDELNGANMRFLLYECTGDLTKAKEELKRAIQLGLTLEKYNIVSNAYSNYSHVCMKQKSYEDALQYAKRGLEMAKRHTPKTPILEVRVKLNMAKAYSELEEFIKAKQVMDEIEEVLIAEQFLREEGQFYDLKGHWCLKQHRYRDALVWYTKAKTIVDTYKDLYVLRDIEETRCNICEKLGDYKLGYKIQKEYILLLKAISKKEMEEAIIKNKIAYKTLRFQQEAILDELTGIYNRKGLKQTIAKWQSQQADGASYMTCLIIDIDNFKTINDQYGHITGDQVIKKVVACSKQCLSSGDLLARYGGDELLVVFREGKLKEMQEKAKKILELVRKQDLVVDGEYFKVTLSMGMANRGHMSQETFESIFSRADKALYHAKRNGKNQICYDMR